MASAALPVYIAHGRAVICLDCGGVSDAINVCPCSSHALYNLANILDRSIDSLEPEPKMVCDSICRRQANDLLYLHQGQASPAIPSPAAQSASPQKTAMYGVLRQAAQA